MRNIGILLAHPIPLENIIHFVEELGGEWQDYEDWQPQGWFSRGDACAFLRGAATQEEDLCFWDAEDLEAAERECGPIRATLVVDYTRDAEAITLARWVCEELLKRWKGYAIECD